jgi:hypothetical protein
MLALGAAGDMLAVAAAAADERALHSMGAHGRPGAAGALALKRGADRVASIAGDIVGDVSGAVSGAAAAVWAGSAAASHGWSPALLRALAVALVAAATVGLKAALKGVALEHAEAVLHLAGSAGRPFVVRRRGAGRSGRRPQRRPRRGRETGG